MKHTFRAAALRATLVAALLFAGGCALQQIVREGDTLLQQRQYNDAAAKYEEALALDPEYASALAGIKEARRGSVAAQLREAENALSVGDAIRALAIATHARTMRLDLDAVDLVRRIDTTIAEAAAQAERRIDALVEQGHFPRAIESAERLQEADPSSAERRAWLGELRARAKQHYLNAAQSYRQSGSTGAAALQLAMAKRLGADVAAQEIADLWNAFVEPTCYAAPTLVTRDISSKGEDLLPHVERSAREALHRVTGQCGRGTRPLTVSLTLSHVALQDETGTTQAAKPLPGETLATEEVYYEEIPYTVVEEVTEYETRKQLVEKRDCAPRPGKPRGCVTWTEEQDTTVPVARSKEVQKMKRVERRRPIAPTDLPTSKVLLYDLTSVSRKVGLDGSIEVRVEGAEPLIREFHVLEVSHDTGNPEARGGTVPKALVIPADPLEVESMARLIANSATRVAQQVERALLASTEARAARYAEQARADALQGRLPQAEEQLLRMLALGHGDDADTSLFFKKRYGESPSAILATLVAGLGRTSSTSEGRAGTGTTPQPAPQQPPAEDGARKPVPFRPRT